MLKLSSSQNFGILSSDMGLVGHLLILAVAIPSALAKYSNTPFSCDCRIAGHCLNYHIECGGNKENRFTVNGIQSQCRKYTGYTCFSEVTAYVPEGYEYLMQGLLYKLYVTAMSYNKAADQCRCDGGKLAIPTSLDEARAIASIIKNSPAAVQAFIGINDIAKEGTYVSIDGTYLDKVGYKVWEQGEPDNWQDAEDCVTINAKARYSDVSCYKNNFFICQRDVSPVPPIHYKYLPQLGFYRHYTAPEENFAAARKKCLDDGGYLAVIEKQKEAEELVEFFFVDQWNGWTYVGVLEEGGVFVTETGKKLSELSFVSWANREPSNVRGQQCVVLLPNGSYEVVSCDTRLSYLCEFPLRRIIAI